MFLLPKIHFTYAHDHTANTKHPHKTPHRITRRGSEQRELQRLERSSHERCGCVCETASMFFQSVHGRRGGNRQTVIEEKLGLPKFIHISPTKQTVAAGTY